MEQFSETRSHVVEDSSQKRAIRNRPSGANRTSPITSRQSNILLRFLGLACIVTFGRLVLLARTRGSPFDSPLLSAQEIRLTFPDCKLHNWTRPPSWIYAITRSQLIHRFPTKLAAARFVDAFFREQTVDADGFETKNIVVESLLISIWGGKMWAPVPQSTKNMLAKCAVVRASFPAHHHNITRYEDEVFCAAHGLATLDPRIVAYVRNRTAIDIGAFNGDSALVLMDYVREVYSFEPGPSNFRTLNNVLAVNPGRFGTTKPFNIALSNVTGNVSFADAPSSQARIGIGWRGEIQVPATTLDAFLEERNVTVGFIKCDTEGHGLKVLQGAQQTIKRDRPVMAFAVYHNFEEFFGIPRMMREFVPDYAFKWEFEMDCLAKWHEMVFIAYPPEIIAGGRSDVE
jgi:FkbM family methyltransferase